MKYIFSFTLLLLLLFPHFFVLQAQTDTTQKSFEELFKEDLEQQQNSFLENVSEQTKAFLLFKQELDKAFANALKTDWKEYKGEPAHSTEETPKSPEAPTITEKTPERKSSKDLKVIKPEPTRETPLDINISLPKILTVEAPSPTVSENTQTVFLDFEYLKTPLRLVLSDDFKLNHITQLNETTIGEFWQEISKKNYAATLQALWKQKEQWQLNDWGYYQLVKKTSERLFPNQRNESTLFTWFIILKSGYKARIGYSGNQAFILLPFTTLVYEKTYFRLDEGEIFYVIEAEQGTATSLKIADFRYPEAKNTLSLFQEKPIKVNQTKATRALKFTHKFLDYNLSIDYQPTIASYFSNYPLTEPQVIFKATPSATLAASLQSQLTPYLKGKTEKQSVDFLLAFVQKSFAYQTDQEQFDYEKPLTAEETLFYPYSDCEDRAVLFSHLIKNILGLKVVGLDYPGHMAVAVKFNEKIEGDFCMYQNEKYMVCDPTYINAVSGQSMKELAGISPKIIALEK